MPQNAIAPCPKCGQSESAIISITPEYAVDDVLREREAIAYRRVFKCPCGLAFTHTVNVEPGQASKELDAGQ